jgi:hypothetical protein
MTSARLWRGFIFFGEWVIPKARVFASGPRDLARTPEQPTRDPLLRLESATLRMTKILARATMSGFTKSILALVQQRFITEGFRKRKFGILSIPVSADVLGLVGLNTATHSRGRGVIEINPVVGVRNQRVERLVAELKQKPFDEVSPFTTGVNVGYLSPASRYQTFVFVEGESPEPIAEDLASAVQNYGIPFVRSNIALPSLFETLRSRFSIPEIAEYRIPVVLHLMGRDTEADAFLDDELSRIASRSDAAAELFRTFATSLRERILQSSTS